MKTKRWLIFAVIFGSFLLAAPPAAHADALDTLGDVMQALGQGNMVGDVKQIFTCLGNATDDVTVIACIDGMKDNQTASSITGGDIPSWFWDLLDIYVDIRTDNVWDLIEKVGLTVVCAAAQGLTGGIDICGVVGEIIDALEDVGGAVVAFLKDIAAAMGEAWDDFKCLFEDCGSSLTGLQIAWRDFFQDILYCSNGKYGQCGITWRETGPFSMICAYAAGSTPSGCPADNFLDKTFTQQQAALQVIHTNSAYGRYPIDCNTLPGFANVRCGVYDSDVNAAMGAFMTQVYAQWDGDIVQKGGQLDQLTAARSDFMNASTQDMVTNALNFPDKQTIAGNCTNMFKTKYFQFAHIDYWLTIPTSSQSGSIKAGLKSTADWCQQDFYYNRRQTAIFQAAASWIKSKLQCVPASVQSGIGDSSIVWCPASHSYNRCNEVLSSLQPPAVPMTCGLQPQAQCPVTDGKYICPTQAGYQNCAAWVKASGYSSVDNHCILQPQCPNFLGTYYCTSLTDYQACLKWSSTMGYPAAQNRCGFDTSVAGPEWANIIKQKLVDGELSPGVPGVKSKFAAECTIDGKGGEYKAPSSGTTIMPAGSMDASAIAAALDNSKSPAASPSSQAKKATQDSAKLSGAEMARTAASMPALPRTGPSVLDCPRPTLKHFCEVQVQHRLTGQSYPGQLVTCTVSHVDPDYQQLANRAQAYAKSVGQVYSTYDPLLLVSIPGSCPHGFMCVQDLQETVDGRNALTIFQDSVAAAKAAALSGAARGAAAQQSQTTPGTGPAAPTAMPGARVVTTPGTTASAAVRIAERTVPSGATAAASPATGTAAAITNFNKAKAVWKGLPTVPVPNVRCGCADTYVKIDTIDKLGETWIKDGDELSASLNAHKLDAATAEKATQRLQLIAAQLSNSVTVRATLVTQYTSQWKAMPAAQQKR